MPLQKLLSTSAKAWKSLSSGGRHHHHHLDDDYYLPWHPAQSVGHLARWAFKMGDSLRDSGSYDGLNDTEIIRFNKNAISYQNQTAFRYTPVAGTLGSWKDVFLKPMSCNATTSYVGSGDATKLFYLDPSRSAQLDLLFNLEPVMTYDKEGDAVRMCDRVVVKMPKTGACLNYHQRDGGYPLFYVAKV